MTLDEMREREAALAAELKALRKQLKAEAPKECPALERWDFWNDPRVRPAYDDYLLTRSVYGPFDPETKAAYLRYARAAMNGEREASVYERRGAGIASRSL